MFNSKFYVVNIVNIVNVVNILALDIVEVSWQF